MILEKTKPAQGSWTTSKVYTLGGGDIGFIIGEREISGQNNTDRWYHYDRLGNVMAQTNSSGQASTTYDQDAFGNVLSGSTNGYHLTTKDNHTDIGLYYFYKRWYDPMLGRFTIIEPILKSRFFPQMFLFSLYYSKPYIYCANNPLRYKDTNGLQFNSDDTEDYNELFPDCKLLEPRKNYPNAEEHIECCLNFSQVSGPIDILVNGACYCFGKAWDWFWGNSDEDENNDDKEM